MPSIDLKVMEATALSVLFLCPFFQWFEISYVLHFKLSTFWHFCKKAPCSNFNVACDTDVLPFTAG